MFSYQHSAFSFFNQEGHKIPLSPPLEKGGSGGLAEYLPAVLPFGQAYIIVFTKVRAVGSHGSCSPNEGLLRIRKEPYESLYLRLDVKETS